MTTTKPCHGPATNNLATREDAAIDKLCQLMNSSMTRDQMRQYLVEQRRAGVQAFISETVDHEIVALMLLTPMSDDSAAWSARIFYERFGDGLRLINHVAKEMPGSNLTFSSEQIVDITSH